MACVRHCGVLPATRRASVHLGPEMETQTGRYRKLYSILAPDLNHIISPNIMKYDYKNKQLRKNYIKAKIRLANVLWRQLETDEC